MSKRQRSLLIGLCVAVVVVTGVAVAFAVRGRSSGSSATAVAATQSTDPAANTSLVSLAPIPAAVSTTVPRARTTTTAAPAVQLLTTTSTAPATPTSLTTLAPLPTTAVTAPPVTNPVVTGEGAILTTPSSADVRPLGTAGDCTALTDRGFTGSCGTVTGAGGTLAYLVERSVSTAGWRAYVFRVDSQRNTATVILSALDDSARDYTVVKAVVADVAGDGTKVISLGFHLVGSAQALAVDLVDGTGTVVVHRDLARGAAWTSLGSFDDWELAPGDTSSAYVHTVIHRVSGVWRIVQQGPASSVPASQL